MVYTPGGTVQAADYNNLAYETGAKPTVLPTTAKVGDIFGTGFGNFGYGGNSTNVGVADLPTIASGEIIQSDTDVIGAPPPGVPDEWVTLRNAFFDCAAHQGTVLNDTLPALSVLEDGDIVSANTIGDLDNLDSDQNNSALAADKNLSDGESFSIATKLTSARGTPWSVMLRHEFTVDFGTENAARHYFNTGGELRISASRAGGSATPQNTAWTSLVSANSPYVFSQTDYFALTGVFVIKRAVTSGAPYATNNWTIRARRENFVGALGGNGSLIRFQSDFIDSHNNIFFDSVDGTFTSTIDEKRSTGIFVRSSPTFTTITDLTAGV